MRVLFVETHYRTPVGEKRTSAVDWWRVINPATHLKKNTNWKIEVRKGILSRDNFEIGDPQAEFEWECVGKNWDLVWFSYLENGLAYSFMKVVSNKFGVKFIIDFDDNMLAPSLNNPYFIEMNKDKKKYKELLIILEDAPYISVTNSFLKKAFKDFRQKENEKIFVLNNYIDLGVYKAKDHIEDDVVTIGWFGGVNHYDDLFQTPFAQVIPYILGKYKNVRFEMVGFLGENNFKGLPRFQRFEGNPDFWEWIKIWQDKTRRWDIGVCPLEDNDFSRGKSSIKTFEMGAAKLPVVVSDVKPYRYIQDGKTGYKCSTTRDWIRALEELIENENKRRELGENLYQEIEKNYTIQKNWWRWKEVIVNICNTTTSA